MARTLTITRSVIETVHSLSTPAGEAVAQAEDRRIMWFYVVKHPDIPGLVVVTQSLVGCGQALARFKTRKAAERRAALLNGTA